MYEFGREVLHIRLPIKKFERNHGCSEGGEGGGMKERENERKRDTERKEREEKKKKCLLLFAYT